MVGLINVKKIGKFVDGMIIVGVLLEKIDGLFVKFVDGVCEVGKDLDLMFKVL